MLISLQQFMVAVAGAGLFFLCALVLVFVLNAGVGRLVAGASRPLARLDAWLAVRGGKIMGLDHEQAWLRWPRLITTLLAPAFVGSLLPPLLSLPVLILGLIGVLAVFRRWSWDEADRTAGLPPAARRIPGHEDYTDEMLAALSAVFMYGALITWRVGGAFPFFEGGAEGVQGGGLISYFLYVAGEAVQAVPIIGNVDMIGWRNPSGLELSQPFGGYFAFSMRTLLDVLVIGGLLKAIEIAGRINRGEDLRRLEAAANGEDDAAAATAIRALANRTARGSAEAGVLLERLAVAPPTGEAAPIARREAATRALEDLGEHENGVSHLSIAVVGWRGLVDEAHRSGTDYRQAAVTNNLGVALSRLGRRMGGLAGLETLRQAEAMLQSAMQRWTALDAPLKAAQSQANLASTLLRIGQRAAPEQARVALERSLVLLEDWMAERGEAASPYDRANMGNNIGIVLLRLAMGRPGHEARPLLERSIATLERALGEPLAAGDSLITTLGTTLDDARRDLKGLAAEIDVTGLEQSLKEQEAALAQAREAGVPLRLSGALAVLGLTLQRLSDTRSGAAATADVARAVDLFKEAVEVSRAAGLQDERPHRLNDVGVASDKLARRLAGDEAQKHWRESIAAYQEALSVWNEHAHPLDWARAQHNLAVVLRTCGLATPGEGGAVLMRQAIVAGRDCLRVRTREAAPRDWSATQKIVAITLTDLAWRSPPPERFGLVEQSVSVYRDILSLLTPQGDPQEWPGVQSSLGVALEGLGDLVNDPADKARYYGEAVTAHREALSTPYLEQRPQDWAQFHFNLGTTHDRLARALGWPDGEASAREAVAAMEAALTVWTLDYSLSEHARGLFWLSGVTSRLAVMNRGRTDVAGLQRARDLFDQAHALSPHDAAAAEYVWFDAEFARAAQQDANDAGR